MKQEITLDPCSLVGRIYYVFAYDFKFFIRESQGENYQGGATWEWEVEEILSALPQYVEDTLHNYCVSCLGTVSKDWDSYDPLQVLS